MLIIYYKQISEGYEDQRRYQILRQVGMSPREVRASIRSQVLLVFFLPLGTAAIHILAAFPMLCKLLELFNLYDIRLFALCTAGTLLVFCGIYALVYGLTARAYHRIYTYIYCGSQHLSKEGPWALFFAGRLSGQKNLPGRETF